MKKLNLALFLFMFSGSEIVAAEKDIRYPSTYGIEIGMSLTEAKAKARALGLKTRVVTHLGAQAWINDEQKIPDSSSEYLRQTLRAYIYPKNPKNENVEESGWSVSMLQTYNAYSKKYYNHLLPWDESDFPAIETVLKHYIKTYGPIRSAFLDDGSSANVYFVFNPLQTTGKEISVAEALVAEAVGDHTASARRCSEGLSVLSGLSVNSTALHKSDVEQKRRSLTDRYGKSAFLDWAQCKRTVLLTIQRAGLEGVLSQKISTLSVTSGDLELIEPLLNMGDKIHRIASGADSVK